VLIVPRDSPPEQVEKIRQWSNRLTDVHPENGHQIGGDGGDGAATEILLLGGHIELTCPVLVLMR